MSPSARELLFTRGIYAKRIPLPLPSADGCVQWVCQPSPDVPAENVTWYIDGSLIDAELGDLARLGVGMVGVDDRGCLEPRMCVLPTGSIRYHQQRHGRCGLCSQRRLPEGVS